MRYLDSWKSPHALANMLVWTNHQKDKLKWEYKLLRIKKKDTLFTEDKGNDEHSCRY